MNPLQSLWQRYRRWEDGYLAALDALDAGRPVDPAWSATRYRRRFVRNYTCLSPGERGQVRDFIVRYRGWRGVAWVGALLGLSIILGSILHVGMPAKFALVEAIVFIALLVFSLTLGIAASWFSASRFVKAGPRKLILIALLAVAGALLGGVLGGLKRGESPLDLLGRAGGTVLVAGVATGLVYAAAIALVALMRNRELTALNARLAAEAERERLSAQLAESRLRLLQAQVEPHFLFNTLGAVQQLAERGAPEAATLTSHLIRFLRGATGSFRSASTTLGAELPVIESYLQIMQRRLGDRLAFALDVPADLHAVALRPTLLITLVENAVKHGIEPHPPGGTITLAARRDGGLLEIEVADTGAGMAELPGEGHGLANVREQLRLAYGERASLELFDNLPHGVVARVRFPTE